MKLKYVLSLLVITLFAWLTLTTNGQTAAQTQENLLSNPGFEGGHHHQGGFSEITVPDGWTLHWLDNVGFAGSNGVAYRPESVVWWIQDAPPDEQSLFFRDGSYVLKVFKSWAPLYAALSQDVSGLEVGRRYRLAAPIFIDIVESYDGGEKVAPGDPGAGQVRLGASPVGAAWRDGNAIVYSGWWTAASVSPFYLSYPVFTHDFTATSENMTVWIEFASKQPYQNNGFFLDGLGLYALDEVDTSVNTANEAPPPAAPAGEEPAAPAPTLTPFPTPTPRADGSIVHVVQRGDTLWGIAIQYAPTLGMSAEEALDAIREINDDLDVLSVGRELLIATPSATARTANEETAAAESEQVLTTDTSDDEADTGEENPEADMAESTAVDSEATATTEPEETETSTETLASTSTPESEPEAVAAASPTNSICVSVYEDEDGDGQRASSDETLLADAAVSLFRAGKTVTTYVSDGSSEPYCFEDLDSDTYQVQVFPPDEYETTTAESWAIAVSDGDMIPVEFGAQHAPQTAVAAEVQPDTAVTGESGAAGDALTASVGPAESGGGFSNVGTIVLAIAGVLVLVAAAGIVLLRRS